MKYYIEDCDLTGKVIKRENRGDIIIKGVVRSDCKDNGKINFECSVCSLDKELWKPEEMVCSRTRILQARVNCSCNPTTFYNKRQNNLRFIRKADSLGFEFLGLKHEDKAFKGNKVRLYNPVNQVCWEHTIQLFLKHGSKCPYEIYNKAKNLKDDVVHITAFMKTGAFSEGTIFERSGVDNKGRKSNVHWKIICPVCTKDKYSHIKSEFISHITGLKGGNKPCRCSGNYRWSEEENLIRIKDKSEELGYYFLGWKGEYKGDNTKLKLSTKEGEVWSTTTITNLMQGKGHRSSRLREAQNTPVEYYLEKANLPKGSAIERIVKEDKNLSSKVRFTCGICSKDEYVQNKLCSGTWETDLYCLINGGRPCRCSSPYYWTFEQIEYKISKILKEEGGRFIGWAKKETPSRSKFKWVCREGGYYESLSQDFISGKRPNRNSFGFDKGKSGHIYLCRWYGFGEEYLKVGITNNDCSIRFKQQGNKSKLDLEILYIYFSDNGDVIADTEKAFLNYYSDVKGCCKKGWFLDGYTETIPYNKDTIDRFNVYCQDMEKLYDYNLLT